MKFPTFTKMLLTTAVVLAALKSLGYSLYAMNLNSDFFAVAGVFGVLVTGYVTYLILKFTWRKHENK